ncbi:hypothetical protein ACFPAF_12695 [Hymenobacter endophyticus]|uniref:Uncharacterized protein n=1 Tax=Hymenobacter endophyticus TaxID=3076335 RepID=A0ABU3TIR2_9BACT|nr:hypothetical protein [Hymenobacter endophyticus]MDU0371258.1 hypothetical protein [Hymenobacter endophyticus]
MTIISLVEKVLRAVKFLFSSLILCWMLVFMSPYKEHYLEISRYYFDDDSIFFGMMLSFLGFLVHLPSILVATFPLRTLSAKANLLFGVSFILMLAYWGYYMHSDAAMHEQ